MGDLKIGDYVEVTDANSWLKDKKGYVVIVDKSNHAIVNFEKVLTGWISGPSGRVKVHTHNCQGMVKSATGYLFNVRQLSLAKF